MDFISQFTEALTDTPVLPKGVMPSVFVGTPYSLLEETRKGLLTILSGGTIEAREKYAYTLGPLDCRMLLYTRRGGGTLQTARRTYRLEKGTLLYLDCSAADWALSLAGDFWQYSVFFIATGEQLLFYESLAAFTGALLIDVPSYSDLLPNLEKLLANGGGKALRNKLTDANLLTAVLTELLIEGFHLETTEVRYPSYLLEIRRNLDIFFMDPFSLEALEERYHLSKYRICREFSEAFGLPPLKYLTRRRIEAAKNLLLSTDMQVHEIASEIGYENTSHFINLFKKETGLTPLVWRDTVSS